MRRGFTLVELLVVIAVIGVLAAMLLPNAFRSAEKARIARTAGDMKSIKTACIVYFADVGEWPRNQYLLNGHNSLMENIEAKPGWNGPYLEKIGKSPLVQQPVPGMAHPGYYYVWGRHHDSSYAYFWFNLDNSGAGTPGDCEVKDGISVALYGITHKEALKLDEMFDGVGRNGYYGMMNVIGSTYWLISLMMGETGISGGYGVGY